MERKPLSGVTMCGNHPLSFLSTREGGTWGEDPEAKSWRDEGEQTALYSTKNPFGFLILFLIPNLEEFDPRPSLNPGWRRREPRLVGP